MILNMPLVKDHKGRHWFVVPQIEDKCNNCGKLNDDDCTPHTQPLPFEHQCGPSDVVYIRASVKGVAEYVSRRLT